MFPTIAREKIEANNQAASNSSKLLFRISYINMGRLSTIASTV